jgi:hypothetical protein
MTVYDKYNICKESEQAVFVSTLTNEFFIVSTRETIFSFLNLGL